ncbi:MAG: hypothetical protein QM661_14785 [Solimonas sp.]
MAPDLLGRGHPLSTNYELKADERYTLRIDAAGPDALTVAVVGESPLDD